MGTYGLPWKPAKSNGAMRAAACARDRPATSVAAFADAGQATRTRTRPTCNLRYTLNPVHIDGGKPITLPRNQKK